MIRALFALLFFAVAERALADEPPLPDATVRNAVQELAAIVSDCRLPLTADPVAVRGLVDQYIRPRVDVLYGGQLILGRAWADASPEQRRRFAEALYGSLSSRYAYGLLLLTDRNVQVPETATPPGNGEAAVELLVQAGLMTPLPVQLQMRRSDGKWRVYDARWEGQSYTLSLRQAVAEAVRRDGLDAVITQLERSVGTPPGVPAERQTSAGRCLRSRAATR
jgi:phospholipid transport system substrate-binding protein